MSETRDGFAQSLLPPREHWPERIFERPELQYPDRLNCARELLDAHNPDQTALIAGTQCFRYGELSNEVARIAQILRDDLGLIPGNRVLIRGTNTPRMAAILLAVWKIGAIAVPTLALLRAHELGRPFPNEVHLVDVDQQIGEFVELPSVQHRGMW